MTAIFGQGHPVLSRLPRKPDIRNESRVSRFCFHLACSVLRELLAIPTRGRWLRWADTLEKRTPLCRNEILSGPAGLEECTFPLIFGKPHF
jgi:hypothetical protein